jgi:hypothetical protein
MARKEGFPDIESGAAIAEPVAAAVQPAAEKNAKKWLPLPLKDDGTPDTDKLPPAKFVEKVRALRLADGSTVHQAQQIFVKAGEPRYAVNENGEVIAWYRKRGGVGRKLIYQFKRAYPDSPRGKELKSRDSAMRKKLRGFRIPGA